MNLKNIHIFSHPRIVFMLGSIPFMILCPLIIIASATGFPIVAWVNNDRMNDYVTFFDSLEFPEETRQLGVTVSEIGNFFVDVPEEDADVSDQLKAEVAKNSCDLYVSKILISNLSIDDVSALILADYSSRLNPEDVDDRPPNFDILFTTTLSLNPLNFEENVTYSSLSYNFNEDFEINGYTLAEGENAYILQMVNEDAFNSRDFRCQD